IAVGEPDPLLTPSRFNRRVTEPVAAAILRAMSLRSSDRYASAGLMREAMREAHRQSRGDLVAFGTAPAAPWPGTGAWSKETVTRDSREPLTRPLAYLRELKVPETVAIGPKARAEAASMQIPGTQWATFRNVLYTVALVAWLTSSVVRGINSGGGHADTSRPPYSAAGRPGLHSNGKNSDQAFDTCGSAKGAGVGFSHPAAERFRDCDERPYRSSLAARARGGELHGRDSKPRLLQDAL